ncbi:hypothetical protein JCM10212_003714 [Sporobolomyces blumeae]
MRERRRAGSVIRRWVIADVENGRLGGNHYRQPRQARMAGSGEKADRRPIDPPPIIRLRLRKPAARRKPLQALTENDLVAPTLTHTLFMFASLVPENSDEELYDLTGSRTKHVAGSVVSSLFHLKDQSCFVFPDLSVRAEGRWRFKMSMFEIVEDGVMFRDSVMTEVFQVFSSKRFPGMGRSTELSKSFAQQGLKLRIRRPGSKDDDDKVRTAPRVKSKPSSRVGTASSTSAPSWPLDGPLGQSYPRSPSNGPRRSSGPPALTQYGPLIVPAGTTSVGRKRPTTATDSSRHPAASSCATVSGSSHGFSPYQRPPVLARSMPGCLTDRNGPRHELTALPLPGTRRPSQSAQTTTRAYDTSPRELRPSTFVDSRGRATDPPSAPNRRVPSPPPILAPIRSTYFRTASSESVRAASSSDPARLVSSSDPARLVSSSTTTPQSPSSSIMTTWSPTLPKLVSHESSSTNSISSTSVHSSSAGRKSHDSSVRTGSAPRTDDDSMQLDEPRPTGSRRDDFASDGGEPSAGGTAAHDTSRDDNSGGKARNGSLAMLLSAGAKDAKEVTDAEGFSFY